VSEPPGQGLRGTVSGQQLQITSRGKLAAQKFADADQLPPVAGGLEYDCSRPLRLGVDHDPITYLEST
jgi:hypothetical protein